MSFRIIAVLLTAGLLSIPAQAAGRGRTDPLLQQAQTQFQQAEKLESALNERTEGSRARADYMKVINAYQRVYLITPHTGYADNALMNMARLYEQAGAPADAMKTLAFLLREYPSSPFKNSAERDVARLKGAPEGKVFGAVENIRFWDEADSVRVVVDVSGEVTFKQGEAKSPERVFIDISPARLNSMISGKQWPVDAAAIKQIRVAQYDASTVRVVLEVASTAKVKSFRLTEPDRVIVDVPAPANLVVSKEKASATSVKTSAAAPPRTVAAAPLPPAPTMGTPVIPSTNAQSVPTPSSASAAVPIPAVAALSAPPPPVSIPVAAMATVGAGDVLTTAPAAVQPSSVQAATDPSRSLIRSLGLKVSRVVIDAGHGGHDTGSIGPSGYTEKDLVLDVAVRLKELIVRDLGAEVVMTREDDTFVPLESRTTIANRQKADLFISIHANSSGVKSVQGVETFFLNFSSSREAAEIAGRENAASEKSIHELQDIAKKIMLHDKVEESRELAQHIQKSMASGRTAAQNRGVKQAPFVVLIGADMPSILAEIGFISNPQEEKSAKTSAYRQQIAESLFKGIKSYAETLSGLKTARVQDRD